jgi:hypothetical protein
MKKNGYQVLWHEKVICGARNRKGVPCQCAPLPGKRRCKFHGGASTGPKTAEGKARSLAAMQTGWERWNEQRLAALKVADDSD